MNVKEVLPKEGVTGWSDSWMLSKKAKHPICAYKYMNYITQPDIQAKVADVTGYSPANLKTCEVVGAQRCKDLHIRDTKYYDTIKYWETPTEPDQLQAVDGRLGGGPRLTHAASPGRSTPIHAAGSGSCSGRPCCGCSSSTSSRSCCC